MIAATLLALRETASLRACRIVGNTLFQPSESTWPFRRLSARVRRSGLWMYLNPKRPSSHMKCPCDLGLNRGLSDGP